jgi:hypothetical protein
MTVSLPCPGCKVLLTVDDILEAASSTVPDTALLSFSCPSCSAQALAQIRSGHVAVGAVPADDASPFRPLVSVADADLQVRRDGHWTDCWHGKVYRRIPEAR